MITPKDIAEILKGYDLKNITIGALGGHSALDVCRGAKKHGFKTVVVCQKGREKTYAKYYKTRDGKGCIDEVILVDKFSDIVNEDVQEKLCALNTLFVHNRYFWVYFKDYSQIENKFRVPILGSRDMVRLEERDQPKNQYYLLEQAGIKTPKIIRKGGENLSDDENHKRLNEFFKNAKGKPLLVKANEATRSYERAFFVITNTNEYAEKSGQMIKAGITTRENVNNATIEEFIIGAQVNFNYFYSSLTGELELMGTDTRRQTSLDGFLRLDAKVQTELLDGGYKPSMIETGHITCTVKESIVEKAFEAGEKFVAATQKEHAPGIIGAFALQGAIAAEHGKEEIVIFDVSMRIPGSPGTPFTPYSSYLYGESISYGERIAMEVKEAVKEEKLEKILS